MNATARNQCIEDMLACGGDVGRILRVVRAHLAACADKSGQEFWLVHKMFHHAIHGFVTETDKVAARNATLRAI